MLTVGLVLHLIGLFNILVHSATLWAIWVHLSMLGLDGAGLYGLMRGRKWGRVLSLTIFAAFGLVQLYLGLAYLATGGKSQFGPQNAAAFAACAAAALWLIRIPA